jgi:hypothetical protein
MKYIPSGTSKPSKTHPEGKPYPHKVDMGSVAGVTVSLSDGWRCGGIGVALSGAVNVDQLPKLIAFLSNQNLSKAIDILNTGEVEDEEFVPDSSGAFVPSSPAALQDDRLIGAAVGTTGDLPGVGRIRVTTTEGHYEMA